VSIVSVEIPSDLSGRLRSHFLDDVEHLFEAEAMLPENRLRKVAEVGLAVLAPVLLGVLVDRSAFDDGVIPAMDTRHRLAEAGETETLEASLTRWKEDLS
jgi:hypothetical protein